MRIAILTNAFPPDGRGGAERIAWLQATGLALRGHDVCVWAPGTDAVHQSSSTDGINVKRFPSSFHRLASMNILSRLMFHLSTDIRPYPRVVHEIIDWKPDVLLSHNVTGCGIGSSSAIQTAGIPWVHILHDVQLTDPSGQILARNVDRPLSKMWRSFWAKYRNTMFFGEPDVLASPTQWLLDWHKRYGFRGKKELVLPNPVLPGESLPRTFGVPHTVLYVGRLSEEKGFGDFLDALESLSPDVVQRALVLGTGPLQNRLVDPRIEYRGHQTAEQVRLALREAHVLIAPSRILENQQTILLEAMAEGTPVIATDVGGTKETLEGTGCIVLSIPTSSKTLAESVVSVLSDDKKLSSCSYALRSVVTRHESSLILGSLERELRVFRDHSEIV